LLDFCKSFVGLLFDFCKSFVRLTCCSSRRPRSSRGARRHWPQRGWNRAVRRRGRRRPGRRPTCPRRSRTRPPWSRLVGTSAGDSITDRITDSQRRPTCPRRSETFPPLPHLVGISKGDRITDRVTDNENDTQIRHEFAQFPREFTQNLCGLTQFRCK
jgi:hypothetical protein